MCKHKTVTPTGSPLNPTQLHMNFQQFHTLVELAPQFDRAPAPQFALHADNGVEVRVSDTITGTDSKWNLPSPSIEILLAVATGFCRIAIQKTPIILIDSSNTQRANLQSKQVRYETWMNCSMGMQEMNRVTV